MPTPFIFHASKSGQSEYSYFENGCRKKNVHVTISKGNMGYDQYNVPDTVAVELTFDTFR